MGKDGILMESFLFFLMKFCNYAYMLVAMSFNFWVILTMCLSMALTSYVFEVRDDSSYIKAKQSEEKSFRKKSNDQLSHQQPY